ncbi:MAG: SDR family NAD(P)-dependent oxidoreductase, partial [Myxococcales bacterium]|nr:SDR family NAD(P)-dependent oxidoreductase [Myxococcales bacterium]
MTIDAAGFRAKYGPWALVAGASEGIGEAFAEELGARGLNLTLVARRAGPLEAVARRLADRHGVETRAIAQDLSTDDAPGRLVDAVGDREIGFLVYNAAYSVIGRFLDLDVDVHLKTLATNCRTPLVLTHHFGRQMAARGRGGIVWMSSMSSLQGSAMVGSYAATKAF